MDKIHKRIFWCLLIVSISLILFCLGIVFWGWIGVRDINIDSYIESIIKRAESNENTYKIKLEECRGYNLFQQAASKIGKKKYSETYNCLDSAKELQNELRELDIESSIFINKDRSHAWLGIWLEAINGQFIGLDSDYEVMELRDHEMNVILKASWYDYSLAGYSDYSKNYRTCAHRDWPRGTILIVIYQDRFTTCVVNDYIIHPDRDIDLSSLAFSDLAPLSKGILKGVEIRKRKIQWE